MGISQSITPLPSGLSGLSVSARRTGCSITQPKVPEPALLFTVFSETAKLNNLRPYYYFRHILTELPKYCDEKRKYKSGKTRSADALGRGTSRGMSETTPLIKAALNLRVGVFRVFRVFHTFAQIVLAFQTIMIIGLIFIHYLIFEALHKQQSLVPWNRLILYHAKFLCLMTFDRGITYMPYNL